MDINTHTLKNYGTIVYNRSLYYVMRNYENLKSCDNNKKFISKFKHYLVYPKKISQIYVHI